MIRRILLALCVGGVCLAVSAQEPAAGKAKPGQPQVKVNMLNVCAPSAEEQKEIATALARVPRQPLFTDDFEVSRGRTTLTEKPSFLEAGQSAQFSGEPASALWVRMRRELSVQALFSTVQYSFSVDKQLMVETLVLRVRDPKDLMQIAIEDNASSVTSPAAMLGANTPPTRIKLERFGKSSVVLARCSGNPESGEPAPDQSAYNPLFQSGAALMSAYRGLLGVRHTVPDELGRMERSTAKSATPHSPKKPSKK